MAGLARIRAHRAAGSRFAYVPGSGRGNWDDVRDAESDTLLSWLDRLTDLPDAASGTDRPPGAEGTLRKALVDVLEDLMTRDGRLTRSAVAALKKRFGGATDELRKRIVDAFLEAGPAGGPPAGAADRGPGAGGAGETAEEIEKEAREVAGRLTASAFRLLHLVRLAAAVSYIRWFTVECGCEEPWKFQGIPGRFTLVNAHEVVLPASPHRASGSSKSRAAAELVVALSLSVQNRRALATWVHFSPVGEQESVEASTRSGFAIWSDTTAATCTPVGTTGPRVPWNRLAGMTAPHHGSVVPEHQWFWKRHSVQAHAERARPVPVLLSNNKEKTTIAFDVLREEDRCANFPDGKRTRSVDAVLDSRADGALHRTHGFSHARIE